MRPDNPMRNFDPHRVANYEKENYVAYYQKDWFKLLRVSVGMVGEAFALSLWQAIYAAYLIARAEIAFAPFPNNDVPKTEEYVSRFYQFIKNVHHEDFDVSRATKLEVNRWIVHRNLFGNAENQELVEALTNLYVEMYGEDSSKIRESARERARGMLFSDLWVNAGKLENSPLLKQEEEALFKSYSLLKEAVNS